MGADENHIYFEVGPRLLISRTLTGQFPNYEMVMPKTNDNKAEFDSASLGQAIRRVALMADDRSHAIRFHLNPAGQAPGYDPTVAGVAPDLRGPRGPVAPVLARLDPAMTTPINLSNDEFKELVDFVRNGLLDPKARPENLRKLIPRRVPSGRPIQIFE